MKNALILALAYMTSFGCAWAQEEATPVLDLVCKEAHKHTLMSAIEGAEYIEDSNFDLKYARFVWAVDPSVKSISGTVTHHFEVKKEGITSLELNLAKQLTIDSIKFRGQKLTFTQSGNYGLTINLPLPLPLASWDSISITYRGTPPTTGFGSFNQSSHAGVPILWTLSCPFGSQDWWPCKNGLTDKLDSMDIVITVPSQYRAASVGTLVSETTSAQKTTFHWRHRYAIVPYLVSFAVTNYVAYIDLVPLKNGTTMPMVNYVYPESLNAAKSGTADLVQVLQFYDSLFVGYPFAQEKYGHAQFSWGGGMEHQTMSFVTDFSWSLLAHELAHQWFGDMVTCGSWEDVWLNEGAATYLEGLTQERFKSVATWFNWKKGRVNNITSSTGGSVRVTDTLSVNRIFDSRLTYNKGAYLFHMLRWKIGDAAFFSGIRSYLSDREYAFAKTASLKAHLEQASGENLTEFFNDWYVGQGFPRYQLTWSQVASSNQMVIQLKQTQSHPSVSFFEMPVQVLLSGSLKDTLVRLEHLTNGQIFTFPLSFEVTSVSIDPNYWLVSAGNTVQKMSISTVEPHRTGVSVRIQPNPTLSDFATLWVGSAHTQDVHIRVLTQEGRMIHSQTTPLSIGEQIIEIPLLDVPKGIFTVYLRTRDGVLATKLLKM